ncbi:thiamine-phosphate kinase [Pyrodictium abyssi]|uniref:Thiamine-monophosphate kinase n=1 Tax=Pyrodictium abyssi TaxID=54256 RepID=A0ABM8IVM9_9CREN|nr:thiamine-phosphate kinase [Pyrodictium abyssi]
MHRRGTKLAEIGEHRATELLTRLLQGQWRCRSLAPGDDASCAGPGAAHLLVKIDGGGIASNLAPWMSLGDLGWLQVAAAASDLAAKAGRPLVFLVSLGLDPEATVEELEELVRGAAEAARAHGGWLAGGDLNSCHGRGCGWVDVAAVGVARAVPVPRRPGRGDLVYTTAGRLGLGGLVFHSLAEGTWREDIKSYPRAFREMARPLARLGFAELAERLPQGCLTGSADTSDGLAFSLWLLSRSAGAAIEVEDVPVEREAVDYASEKSLDPMILALYGGQEFEVVFTVKPGCADLVEEEAEAIGLRVARIGRVLNHEGPGILHRGRTLEPRGWDNFQGWGRGAEHF